MVDSGGKWLGLGSRIDGWPDWQTLVNSLRGRRAVHAAALVWPLAVVGQIGGSSEFTVPTTKHHPPPSSVSLRARPWRKPSTLPSHTSQNSSPTQIPRASVFVAACKQSEWLVPPSRLTASRALAVTVKPTVFLTDQSHAFRAGFSDRGKFASLSAVVQQG